MAVPIALHHASPAYRHGLATALRGLDLEPVEPDDVTAWAAGEGRRVVLWQVRDEVSWRRMRDVAALPGTVVVALIPEIELGLYARALASGVDGVAHVDSPVELICSVTEAALQGEVTLPAEAARQLAACAAEVEVAEVPALTEQELGLLTKLSAGATVVELAREIFASERTVRRNLQNAYLKLGVTNRAQALTRAAQLGLI